MNNQVKAINQEVRNEQLKKNHHALSRLHAQVLKLNKAVKEASGERHLKLIKA